MREQMLENLKPLEPYCAGVRLIDLGSSDWQDELYDAFRDPVWFALSHFGVGELVSDGRGGWWSPWVAAGVPFVRIFGDLPAYFPVKHVQRFSNSLNIYGHREHHEFYKSNFHNRGISAFVTTGLFDVVDESSVDFKEKVAGRLIIFPKNGNCPEDLMTYWRRQLPEGVSALLLDLAEQLRSNLNVEHDLRQLVLNSFGDVDVSACDRLVFFLCAQLDDYLRREKSLMLATALLDYPVTIRGGNWEHIDFSGRRARYDPDCDYGRTRSLIDSAIAVVDMSPNTCLTPHDRALRAAGRFTAFFTNEQDFFKKNFYFYRDFVFKFSKDSICERIEFGLSRPEAVVEMGVEQGRLMRNIVPESLYVQQMLSAIDAVAMACGGRPEGTQGFVDYS
ncbi:hypothetical protein [Uliginosibacterium sp. TH139]|uniref:hypothetical protein n=1 Tax=Uliginosibacterium sp. TH139 TaxID=2067453 RepID=UPI00117C2A9D|nr:hypothetical protein [Uliginosibacterium sp. TH139]